jgi:hypothetical protein
LIKDLVSPEQKWVAPAEMIAWFSMESCAREPPGVLCRSLSERLHIRLNPEGLIDLDTWMIDCTAVSATRASSGAGKKGSLQFSSFLTFTEGGSRVTAKTSVFRQRCLFRDGNAASGYTY